MRPHIFVCYDRKDEQFVLILAGHLKAHGVPVWLDQWDIPGGANWQNSIDKAIQDCAKFLIVLSPAAVDSEEVEGELQAALDDQKPVVSVLYQPCRIPRHLRSQQYIDFTRGDQNIDNIFVQLIDVLGGKQVEAVESPSLPEPVAPLRPVSKIVHRSSKGSNVFWGAAIVLGLAFGVWFFFSTAKQQREPFVERPKAPETREAPSSKPPTVQPQTLPIAVPPSPVEPAAPIKEMVRVPAGAFFMGCNEKVDKECFESEKPGRKMNLSAFSIDTTEVTVVQFAKCVADGKCSEKGLTIPYYENKEQLDFAWACNWGKAGRENHPINCVDWGQAKVFCEWVGKRLPTEAEWEKAARGVDGRKYPWGNKEYREAGKVANIADETAKREQSKWETAEGYDDGFYGTAPVGTFPAGESPSHALDMVGNVWEWTADWFDKEHTYLVVRGGSWGNTPRFARTSYRPWYEPGGRNVSIGFRCVQ